MFKTAFQDEKIHGLIFDGAIFIGNIAFIGFLSRLGDDIADTTANTLLLLAVLTQISGAWFKKRFFRSASGL